MQRSQLEVLLASWKNTRRPGAGAVRGGEWAEMTPESSGGVQMMLSLYLLLEASWGATEDSEQEWCDLTSVLTEWLWASIVIRFKAGVAHLTLLEFS